MTLQSVLGCKVCSTLKKQSVPRSKVFFDAKCASAVFIEYMNGISQTDETSWDQNDPKPCLQGDLNPDQWILTKKVMEKINFRLKLYQLSYAAKLQNGAIFH